MRYRLRTLLTVAVIGLLILWLLGEPMLGVVMNWTEGILWHDD